MDPIGFGLEGFDAIGASRSHDQGELIDQSGVLLGETPFEGAVELARALRAHPKLGPCILERLLIFALGRGLDERERCLFESLQATAEGLNYSAPETLKAIVEHPLFSMSGAAQAEAEE